MQDRLRAEANGEAPPEAPAAPPRRVAQADDDKPKRTRTRKSADTARTTNAAKPAEPAKADVDYSAGAIALVQNVWLGTALIPVTQPYAAVLAGQSDGLATALAEGAKHNETIRGWVSSDNAGMWKLQLAGIAVSMGMTCLQVARDPELRAELRAVTQTQLRVTLKAQGIEIPDKTPEPTAGA